MATTSYPGSSAVVRAVVLLALVVTATCDGGDRSAKVSERGCWVVSTSGAADPLALDLRLVGGVPEDSVVFERVVDVAIGADQRLYVVDGDARSVWVFNTGGRFIHRLGRQGDGPGEFRYVNAVSADSVGLVLVVDASRWAVAVFDRDGELLETRSLEPQPAIGTTEVEVTSDFQIYTAGYYHFGESVSRLLGGRTNGLVRGESTLQRWDGDLGKWQYVADLPGFEVFADASRRRLVDVPYGGKALWAVTRGVGAWYADNRSRTVQSVGDELRCVELAGIQATPVTEAEKENFHLAREFEGSRANLRARMRENRRDVELPAVHPLLGAVVVGADSSLWIRPFDSGKASESDEWIVAARLGQGPARRVRVPRGFDIRQVTRDRVVGVRRNELDVPIVESYLWSGG